MDWTYAGHAFGVLRACSRKEWTVRIGDMHEYGVGEAQNPSRYLRGGPIKAKRILLSTMSP